MLFIYKISQTENLDYDTYDSAIVVAESAEDAKTIHPQMDNGWFSLNDKRAWNTGRWATSPENVTADLVGAVVVPSIKRGVILASFNAG